MGSGSGLGLGLGSGLGLERAMGTLRQVRYTAIPSGMLCREMAMTGEGLGEGEGRLRG